MTIFSTRLVVCGPRPRDRPENSFPSGQQFNPCTFNGLIAKSPDDSIPNSVGVRFRTRVATGFPDVRVSSDPDNNKLPLESSRLQRYYRVVISVAVAAAGFTT